MRRKSEEFRYEGGTEGGGDDDSDADADSQPPSYSFSGNIFRWHNTTPRALSRSIKDTTSIIPWTNHWDSSNFVLANLHILLVKREKHDFIVLPCRIVGAVKTH